MNCGRQCSVVVMSSSNWNDLSLADMFVVLLLIALSTVVYLSFILLILMFTGRQHSLLQSPLLAIVVLSVRLSILSVTRWHCVKMMQVRLMKSSPTDSPRPLVLVIKRSSKNSKRFAMSKGIK